MVSARLSASISILGRHSAPPAVGLHRGPCDCADLARESAVQQGDPGRARRHNPGTEQHRPVVESQVAGGMGVDTLDRAGAWSTPNRPVHGQPACGAVRAYRRQRYGRLHHIAAPATRVIRRSNRIVPTFFYRIPILGRDRSRGRHNGQAGTIGDLERTGRQASESGGWRSCNAAHVYACGERPQIGYLSSSLRPTINRA
jgi:hypothetical protein